MFERQFLRPFLTPAKLAIKARFPIAFWGKIVGVVVASSGGNVD